MERDTYTMTINGDTYLQWNCTEDDARHYYELNAAPALASSALVSPDGRILATWDPFNGLHS